MLHLLLESNDCKIAVARGRTACRLKRCLPAAVTGKPRKYRIGEKLVNGPENSACQGLIDRGARQGSQQEDSLKTYKNTTSIMLMKCLISCQEASVIC
jgi:hypothetical protein